MRIRKQAYLCMPTETVTSSTIIFSDELVRSHRDVGVEEHLQIKVNQYVVPKMISLLLFIASVIPIVTHRLLIIQLNCIIMRSIVRIVLNGEPLIWQYHDCNCIGLKTLELNSIWAPEG